MARRRVKRIVRRGRRIAASAGKGLKGTAVEMVAGGAAYFLHSYARENIEMYRDNQYAPAIVLGVTGHLLKRKPQLAAAGHAVVGLAGYMLAESWDESQNGAPAEGPALEPSAEVQGFGFIQQPRAFAPGVASAPVAAPVAADAAGLVI